MMPGTWYEIIWIFLIYGFLGWCTEVAYAALNTGKFVNRGFLNGPVCPVYGIGVLAVVIVLSPLKENLFILFFGSVVLTTAIEFITGFLLKVLFHNQWWDYSKEPFNICGYVCLKFSILWGIACTLVLDVVHPLIFKAILLFPDIPGCMLMILCLCAFASDLGITAAGILKFNRRLRLMQEIAEKLKEISDEIGENIYENVTEAIEMKEELKDTVEEKMDVIKENLEERKKEAIHLQKSYKELLENRSRIHRRLVKAFPEMKNSNYQESFNKLKDYVNKIKEKRK